MDRLSALHTTFSPSALAPLATLPEWALFQTAAQAAPLQVSQLRLIQAAGLTLDQSAQHASPALDQAAEALLHARQFPLWRERLFAGHMVNPTEDRAAWHSQLRSNHPVADVACERERLLRFVEQANRDYRWHNIVHIGIGGSDWGVRLAVSAFGYASMRRTVRFVANIDGHAVQGGLAGLDPRNTLIVVASKSFSTAETLQNGQRAIEWLRASGIANPFDQVVAITARPDKAREWGVSDQHIFRLWDWVGGRFSLWSAVSLTTALAVGPDVVTGMLAGAAALDDHFAQAPIHQNAPVQMALSGLVNRSVLGYGSLNLAPYDFRLANLVPYVQQLDMESLGKSVTHSGQPAGVPTGPAVWGMPGTDAQHTFFQWLHQGTDGAPVDFIACQHADHGWPDHHRSLLANCLAQREALLLGKSLDRTLAESRTGELGEDDTRWLAHHKVHAGGRPSNLIVLPRLTPETLGALLALYEHKIFVQGVLWGINPFDQWGVEYGKVLAKGIQGALAGTGVHGNHDASTSHWVHCWAPNTQ